MKILFLFKEYINKKDAHSIAVRVFLLSNYISIFYILYI